jgi:hypothetical protein
MLPSAHFLMTQHNISMGKRKKERERERETTKVDCSIDDRIHSLSTSFIFYSIEYREQPIDRLYLYVLCCLFFVWIDHTMSTSMKWKFASIDIMNVR